MNKKIIPIEILNTATYLTYDLIDRVVPDNEFQILRSFLKNMCSLLDDIIERANDNMPIVGYHFAFPAEIFRCFDIAQVCFEGTSYLFSALFPDGTEYFYDKMSGFGHPYHTCTSQKGVMGMALDSLFDFDVIATQTAPCDNGVSSYQFFSEYLNIPLIIGDMPYYQGERDYEYFSRELQRIISELGHIIDQKPDFDKLKQAVKYNTEAHEYFIEINQMRKIIPCPVESMANPIITAAHAFMAGTKQYVNFFKETNNIIKKRVKNGIGRAGTENFRSVWPYMSLFFDFSFYEWLDRDIGLSQIIDIFNYYFFDPIYSKNIDDIFLGLSMQRCEYPMIRQGKGFVDQMIDDYVWAAKEFSADCAILTEHIGCKQLAGGTQLLKEALRDEDIPMCVIEVDVGDKRFTSLETFKHEISEFTKTLL